MRIHFGDVNGGFTDAEIDEIIAATREGMDNEGEPANATTRTITRDIIKYPIFRQFSNEHDLPIIDRKVAEIMARKR